MKKEYRFRHPAGRCIEVMFRFRPGKWQSTGTHDALEAERFAEKVLTDMAIGSRRREGTTLRDFAEGFFSEKDPRGFRKRMLRRGTMYEDSFYEQHQSRLDNYILPAHGDYLITAINDVMIDDFILDLGHFKGENKGEQLANSTKNKVLGCYRIILQEATRLGYIRSNPAKEVSLLGANGDERGYFNEEELELLFPEDDEALIRIWSSLRWAAYFLILRDTGWRPGEVAALNVANYFPELHGIYTKESVDFKTHKIKDRIKTSKKGQKYKDGFLQDRTVQILESLIALQAGQSPYLFKYVFNGKEQFIYPDVANKHLKASAARAGVELRGRTQYCFRHTFNTYYLGRLPELARLILMGHTKNRKEYDHLDAEQTLRRVLAIEGTAQALGITVAEK